MMHRRDALKTACGLLASFILPAPRRRIDLLRWCARRPQRKYGLTLPYTVDDTTYATDGRACVRVRPESADVVRHTAPMPPFGKLPWDMPARGWRSLPRLEPLLARSSNCPACEGYGYKGDAVAKDCSKCDGTGTVWVGSEWDLSVPKTCPQCWGKGCVAPPGAVVCRACHCHPIGTFPSVVCLDGRYFDAALYERVRSLDGEATAYDWSYKKLGLRPGDPLLRFRFDGGDGLMMGMDRRSVEARLVRS
jgi:hypothetical protein